MRQCNGSRYRRSFGNRPHDHDDQAPFLPSSSSRLAERSRVVGVVAASSRIPCADAAVHGHAGGICATSRTSGLRNREFKAAGAAARAWFDTVMPLGIRYESEIGVRIFQGMNKGAVPGNSVSDGF